MASGDKGSKGSFPVSGPKTGVKSWVAAIVCVSAWMFFLGVLVGRGTAPVHFEIKELKKELAQAKEALFKSEIKRFKIPAESQEAPAELSFYDALKEPGKRPHPAVKSATQEIRKPRTPDKPSPHEVQNEIRTEAASGIKEAPKDFQRDSTAEKASEDAVLKPLTLQVASLPGQKDARALVETLKKRGHPAYFEKVEIPGKGVWYRVRIGYFKSAQEATRLLDDLKKERFQPMIVNRNSP